ncbi:hypothetical protein [Streptomyces sp. A5-4]|uniref:hypothetical protein n=1 Tax=Streptomyces sp. A5-4 TaxID=3384771 RepID=UPI003DA98922
MTQTAGEFSDVVTEADSIHKVLRDSHTAFKKHQEDLRAAVDKWTKKNVYISDNGGASSAAPPGAVAGKAKIDAPTQEDCDHAVAEIGKEHGMSREDVRNLSSDSEHAYNDGADLSDTDNTKG